MTGHHKEATHSIHHKILDQITEVTVTPATRTHKTDKVSTETSPEIKGINNNQDMIRETRTTRTGMKTTKTKTGLITEEDQINTNTIETSTRHKSSLNSKTKT